MHLWESFSNETSFETLDTSNAIGFYIQHPFNAHEAMCYKEFTKLPCSSFSESGHLGIHGMWPLRAALTVAGSLGRSFEVVS